MTRVRIAILLALLLCGSVTRTVADSDQEDEFRRLLLTATDVMQRERLLEAEQLFEQAVRMRPDSRDARFGIGTLYIKQGRYVKAIETMESLMADFPGEFPIINNLAWLYATSTDFLVRNGQRAVSLAQEALLLQPNNYHVWNTLSEGHYVSGDYDRALRAAEEALRLSRQARVPPERLADYQRQVDKCRRAAEAMSILE